MLFIFSLLFLPLFRWMKDGSGRGLMNRIGSSLALPGAPFLLALPTVALLILIDPESPIGGWENGGWNYIDLVKFLLIVSSSFAIILGLYEFPIRQVGILRSLFGMKPQTRPQVVPSGEAALAR